VGDLVSGISEPVADPRLEPVGYYRTSKLKVLKRAAASTTPAPPWLGSPPVI